MLSPLSLPPRDLDALMDTRFSTGLAGIKADLPRCNPASLLFLQNNRLASVRHVAMAKQTGKETLNLVDFFGLLLFLLLLIAAATQEPRRLKYLDFGNGRW